MPHSYVSSLYHCVFSTKERKPLITRHLQERLHPYLGGIARKNRMKLLAVGGMPDHVHLLLSLPKTMPISTAMRLIKGGSSKWVHDAFPEYRLFAWQEGYGAFSVGIGDIERTRKYIKNQERHHQKQDFKTEFIAFLDRNGIEYDERYIFV